MAYAEPQTSTSPLESRKRACSETTRAHLELREQVLPLHDISKHCIAPIQQVCTGRRQLRLLQSQHHLPT